MFPYRLRSASFVASTAALRGRSLRPVQTLQPQPRVRRGFFLSALQRCNSSAPKVVLPCLVWPIGSADDYYPKLGAPARANVCRGFPLQETRTRWRRAGFLLALEADASDFRAVAACSTTGTDSTHGFFHLFFDAKPFALCEVW